MKLYKRKNAWTQLLGYRRCAMNKLIICWIITGLIATVVANAGAEQLPQQPGAKTRAQSLYGDINPKFAKLTDDVLYADVWTRPGLSPRDRSLATVSALIAMNRPDQLRGHLQRARNNGLTEEELVEVITHLAFYAGWPSAVTASVVAKDVFQKK